MKLSRFLYTSARTMSDIEALSSGDPKKIQHRAANKVKGRLLARVGFWRWLWR